MHASTLSRARSPFIPEGGRGFLFAPKGPPKIPADAGTLRAIRAEILRIASEDWPKMLSHVVPNKLREGPDHLIGVHVMGYEFNESGRTDDDGDSWTWRTGLGCYTSDPLLRWTTDIGCAIHMARYLCPHLRMAQDLGGKAHGHVTKARFARKHPVASLAGMPIALPEAWPKTVNSYPAIAVTCTFLEAAAMEREAQGLRAV